MEEGDAALKPLSGDLGVVRLPSLVAINSIDFSPFPHI